MTGPYKNAATGRAGPASPSSPVSPLSRLVQDRGCHHADLLPSQFLGSSRADLAPAHICLRRRAPLSLHRSMASGVGLRVDQQISTRGFQNAGKSFQKTGK